MIRKRPRAWIWGDRHHWEITIGRTNISRWCSGAPCSGTARGRHWIRVRRWNSSWYRPSKASRMGR